MRQDPNVWTRRSYDGSGVADKVDRIPIFGGCGPKGCGPGKAEDCFLSTVPSGCQVRFLRSRRIRQGQRDVGGNVRLA